LRRDGTSFAIVRSSYDFLDSVVADVGQEEDFEAAKKKALKVGAVAVYVEVNSPKCPLTNT